MANPEHVEILKSGVEEWNTWRQENPGVRPDLEMVDLRGANLRGANLEGATLESAYLLGATLLDANLEGANLEGATLESAYLLGATLLDANLFRANLFRANLEGANLRGANLENAYLLGAHLEVANLEGADLEGVHLGYANLFRANLFRANLEGANLEGVNLVGANLGDANLEGADLRLCRMQRARCKKTIFKSALFGESAIVDCGLSDCIGLEHCEHHRPSSIDNQTIIKSRGLPAKFLKGCGWQDWEIESAKLFNADLSAEEIAEITNDIYHLRHETTLEIPKLFISYSHADREFVEQLENRLEAARIRYWRDVHHATAGPLDKIISHAIDSSGSVLLILSDKSIESTWVKFEIDKANSRYFKSDIPVLCPIALDDSWKEGRWPENLMRTLKEFNILDFSSWSEGEAQRDKLFKKLIDGLKLFYSQAKDAKRKDGA